MATSAVSRLMLGLPLASRPLAFCHLADWPSASLPEAFHLPLVMAEIRPLCFEARRLASGLHRDHARAGRYGEQLTVYPHQTLCTSPSTVHTSQNRRVSVSMPAAARTHSVVSQKGLRLPPRLTLTSAHSAAWPGCSGTRTCACKYRDLLLSCPPCAVA